MLDAQLIAQRPGDSAFWWWRGESWTHGGFPLPALADLRQSIALSDDAHAAAPRPTPATTRGRLPAVLHRRVRRRPRLS
jgi:hypothetical protein